MNLDANPQDIIPDTTYLPDFAQWDQLSLEEAQGKNQSTRRKLKSGSLSPGCQTYKERKSELSNLNADAFRTVRRLKTPKGKQPARLGNTYEFFRCLEAFTSFWDDPTQSPQLPPSPEITPSDGKTSPGETKTEGVQDEEVLRTASGSTMPLEYRNSVVSALIKLVAYDFGCNVSPSRVEPRLHLSSPQGPRQSCKTYCPSACTFVFKSAMTREAARAGTVHGPVAAVSARGTTDFTSPDMETAQSLDLAREIVAALITAQHRTREGKMETRFGDGEWWTVKKRWGGGSGGPIGREEEKDSVQGDKDAPPPKRDGDGTSQPAPKKPRKNMSIYDNYRMVRPPSTTWDRKTVYEAIGRQKGTDYDDIFVVSSIFHHVSVLRVRVPNRLLEVLDGAKEKDLAHRSWGNVEAWRSPWYDLFEATQRVKAMELLWGVMAFQMREDTGQEEDSKMGNA